MLASQIPPKFVLPFAQNASAQYVRDIPVASQIGIQAGAASLNDGFPPACFTPISAGGTPPFGQDMNGILRQATAWIRWINAGGPVYFDAAFAAAVGGYPGGTVLASSNRPGLYFRALVDGITTNPDVDPSAWGAFGDFTGLWTWNPTNDVLPGWCKNDSSTIGSTSSGATQMANSQLAFPLYSWYWTKFSQTLCPVSGGRGATPFDDFTANKPIATLDMRGVSIVGCDQSSGRLTGVPVVLGNPFFGGALIGENLHPLSAAENGPHGHGVSDPTHFHTVGGPMGSQYNVGGSAGPGNAGVGTNWNTDSKFTGITIQSSGNGSAHNTVGLSFTGTHYFHY